jgi:NADH-quinone oxidoreductase subunit M
MDSFPILSLTTFLPLVGVLFILLIRGEEHILARNARWAALWTSLATFVISLLLWFNFDPTTSDFQFVEKFEWLPTLNIAYHMGIDGISLFFVILSTFLTPICVLASWKAGVFGL